MKTILLPLLLVLSISGIFAQESHSDFGTYYEVGSYGIHAPFHDAPYTSDKSNALFKLLSLQYAYPSPADDLNYLYGVEVCEFVITSDFKSVTEQVDFYARSVQEGYASFGQSRLTKEEKSGSGESYSVLQKTELTIEGIGPVVVTSLYTLQKALVVRRYVISPASNPDNSRISAFFSALRNT